MAFGRRGNVARAKQKGFYHLSLRKLFDLVNVNSMQKGAAAIKPAYSCSQGVPETGTGSRYQPWDGSRASSKRGAQKDPFYCGKVPFGPAGMAVPGLSAQMGWLSRSTAAKAYGGDTQGEERKNYQVQNQVFYISALMVVVSHGHSEEPLYSFPCSRSSVVPTIMWLMITRRVCIISSMMYR